MAAVMLEAAHVETVELGNAILGNELRDGRIALREPSEELGNTLQRLVDKAQNNRLSNSGTD